jgi:uncharacterized membrane protein
MFRLRDYGFTGADSTTDNISPDLLPSASGKSTIINVAILVFLTLGLIFRISNLGQKVFWGDEVYSLLRILGHSTIDLAHQVATGQIISAEVIQQFQAFAPDHGVAETLKVLIREDSHLSPLYFILGNLWLRLWGNSAVALRSLSVMFSLLALPGLYWLCMELFGNRLVGRWAMAMMAVSPISLVFAQEARFYAMWSCLTIYSAAAFLHALHRDGWKRWLLFIGFATAGLYTNMLMAIVIAAFSGYAIVIYALRARHRVMKAVTACSLSMLAFSPWLYVFLSREKLQADDVATDVEQSILAIAKHWATLMNRGFVDFNLNNHTSLPLLILLTLVTLSICLLSLHSLYRLIRHTSAKTWLFVLGLILVMPMAIHDQVLNTRMPPRYLLPMYLGLMLPMNYWLGMSFQQANPKRWLKITQVGVISVMLTGTLASGQMVQSTVWWNKQFSNCNPAIARLVNDSKQPLVISDGTGQPFFDHGLSNVISLSRQLRPNVAMQISVEGKMPEIPDMGYSDRFIFTPSQSLLIGLKEKYGDRLKPIETSVSRYRSSDVCLWKIQ